MAVVIETTLGDMTVDLYHDRRPATCLNFLKLCKMKYYNYNLFHTIRSGFIAQTGDPTGEGTGGESIWGILEGSQKRFFSAEKMPKIRHTEVGLLSMVCTGDMMVGSQFFLTLASDLDSLDGVHCVIGEVTEGHEVLRKINDVICDESHRPYRDVRITHTVVLEDPFNDPPGLRAPSRSPSPSAERLKGGRIAADEDIDEMEKKSAEEIQEMIEEKEAKARATILEIIGDLPDADIAPPENVLFVCKLNPVTTDEDLEIIFSRFGKIVSCEVIRDKKSGDSLQYAFVEFSDKKACEDAYLKMDNVLIDDRRIHVDFSQSVSKIKWLGKGRGVKHINENSADNNIDKNKHKESRVDKKKDNRNSHYDRDNYSRNRNNGREKHVSNVNYDQQEKDTVHKSSSISKSKDSRSQSSRNERNYSYSRHSPSDRTSNDNRNKDNSNYKHRDRDHSSNHKSRSKSSPIRNEYSKSSKSKTDYDKISNTRSTIKNRNDVYDGNNKSTPTSKHIRVHKRSDKDDDNNINKYEMFDTEARTPSPMIKEKSEYKNSKRDKKKDRGIKNNRQEKKIVKRQNTSSSSSSDTDSSDSTSSSTESSSSSESDRKKNKLKRKRKYSSSSSSSDSSSTSSSSSESSSDSSSSSSDTDSDNRRSKKSKIIEKREESKNKKNTKISRKKS